MPRAQTDARRAAALVASGPAPPTFKRRCRPPGNRGVKLARTQLAYALHGLPAEVRDDIEQVAATAWEDTPAPASLMPRGETRVRAKGERVTVDGERAKVVKVSRKDACKLKVRFKGTRQKLWLLEHQIDPDKPASLPDADAAVRADRATIANVLRSLGVAWSAAPAPPPMPPPRLPIPRATTANDSSDSTSDDTSSADEEPPRVSAPSRAEPTDDTSGSTLDDTSSADEEPPRASVPSGDAEPADATSDSTSSGTSSEDEVPRAGGGSAVPPAAGGDAPVALDPASAGAPPARKRAAPDAVATSERGGGADAKSAKPSPADAGKEDSRLRSIRHLFMRPVTFSLFGDEAMADGAAAAPFLLALEADFPPSSLPAVEAAHAAAAAPAVPPPPAPLLRPVLFMRTQTEAELTEAWRERRQSGFKDFKSKHKLDVRQAAKRSRERSQRGAQAARERRAKSAGS
ncbi:hypothetical protein T492DRAFT_1040646 [Pavlovales sp. CCMP2436]|nr:hypothetical protein T492DRAFT_1040646 [Pavlovales sp. CCMP2436]